MKTSFRNMFTVSKMDPVFAPKAPAEVMGRHRGDEYEGAWTTGACRSIPVVDPMQREAARTTLRSQSSGRWDVAAPEAPVSPLFNRHSPASLCLLGGHCGNCLLSIISVQSKQVTDATTHVA